MSDSARVAADKSRARRLRDDLHAAGMESASVGVKSVKEGDQWVEGRVIMLSLNDADNIMEALARLADLQE